MGDFEIASQVVELEPDRRIAREPGLGVVRTERRVLPGDGQLPPLGSRAALWTFDEPHEDTGIGPGVAQPRRGALEPTGNAAHRWHVRHFDASPTESLIEALGRDVPFQDPQMKSRARPSLDHDAGASAQE